MDTANVHSAHPPTSTGLDSRKLGVWAFIGSEAVFFGALISAYMTTRGRQLTGPTAQEVLNINLTAVSTFILLTSSLLMVLSLAAVARGDQRRFRLFLMGTILFGLIFLGGQVYEFSHLFSEGFTLSTNVNSSAFFTLTGFHGAHVT